jgi:hypothetical protein
LFIVNWFLSAFFLLALFGQFLPAFFSVNENVVWMIGCPEKQQSRSFDSLGRKLPSDSLRMAHS